MKSKIAMFNLNSKSTISATLLALIVAAVFIFTSHDLCYRPREEDAQRPVHRQDGDST